MQLLILSVDWGTWKQPVKPTVTMRAYCAILEDIGFRIGKKGEKIFLCASSGFQRGDLVSTPGPGRASTRRYSPYQPQPEQSRPCQTWWSLKRGNPAYSFFQSGPKLTTDGNLELVHLWVLKSAQIDDNRWFFSVHSPRGVLPLNLHIYREGLKRKSSVCGDISSSGLLVCQTTRRQTEDIRS